jgi:hypothetical protein
MGGAIARYSLYNHATEKLGDWDAIICTAFAYIPKKSLLSIRLAMCMSQARALFGVRAEGRLVRISTRPQRRRASFEEKSQD